MGAAVEAGHKNRIRQGNGGIGNINYSCICSSNNNVGGWYGCARLGKGHIVQAHERAKID
jgi:hypothetical protein